MGNELRLGFDTGRIITAKVYSAASNTLTATVSLSEVPASSGRYTGDFPSASAGTFDVGYFDGSDTLFWETLIWNGSAVVTADRAELDEIIDTISASGVTVKVTQPIAEDGSLIIVRGDGYMTIDNRKLPWDFTGINDITGSHAAVSLNLYSVLNPSDTPVASIAAASVTSGVVDGTTHYYVNVDVDHTITDDLDQGEGTYTYALVATYADGQPATLQQGSVRVK